MYSHSLGMIDWSHIEEMNFSTSEGSSVDLPTRQNYKQSHKRKVTGTPSFGVSGLVLLPTQASGARWLPSCVEQTRLVTK